MTTLSLGSLPAIFKMLKSGPAWCCPIANCKGVVGKVHESRILEGKDEDEENVYRYGLIVELPLNYEKHKGLYRKSRRAASRIKELVGDKSDLRYEAWRARVHESDGEKLSRDVDSVAGQIEASLYARKAERGIELAQEKLPVLVACPVCSRVAIISIVKASR